MLPTTTSSASSTSSVQSYLAAALRGAAKTSKQENSKAPAQALNRDMPNSLCELKLSSSSASSSLPADAVQSLGLPAPVDLQRQVQPQKENAEETAALLKALHAAFDPYRNLWCLRSVHPRPVGSHSDFTQATRSDFTSGLDNLKRSLSQFAKDSPPHIQHIIAGFECYIEKCCTYEVFVEVFSKLSFFETPVHWPKENLEAEAHFTKAIEAGAIVQTVEALKLLWTKIDYGQVANRILEKFACSNNEPLRSKIIKLFGEEGTNKLAFLAALNPPSTSNPALRFALTNLLIQKDADSLGFLATFNPPTTNDQWYEFHIKCINNEGLDTQWSKRPNLPEDRLKELRIEAKKNGQLATVSKEATIELIRLVEEGDYEVASRAILCLYAVHKVNPEASFALGKFIEEEKISVDGSIWKIISEFYFFAAENGHEDAQKKVLDYVLGESPFLHNIARGVLLDRLPDILEIETKDEKDEALAQKLIALPKDSTTYFYLNLLSKLGNKSATEALVEPSQEWILV